jgi:hypothetical protein
MDTIPSTRSLPDAPPATLFLALELSRSTWLVALHSPAADKVGQHRLEGGDTEGLLDLIVRKRLQAEEKLGRPVRLVDATSVAKAGRDAADMVTRTGSSIRRASARAICANVC